MEETNHAIVPIIIPSLEPDERLTALVQKLAAKLEEKPE